MDWLSQFLAALGPNAAAAQGLLPPSSTAVTPGATMVPPEPAPSVPQVTGYDETGIGAPGGAPGGVGNGGLGQALEPVTKNPTQLQQQSNALVGALRGIASPPKPDVVKPSTPAAPMPRPIQGGDFFSLLQSMANPRQPLAGSVRGRTLGDALGIGRY